MRMLKYWCCLLLLITGFGLLAQSADNSVRIRASLGASAIQLGDHARLSVTISAPAGTQLGQTNHEVLNQSEGLELIEQIPRNQSASDPTLIVHEEYVLTSFTPGVFLVPPLSVAYTLPDGSRGEATGQSASITVTAIPVEGNEEISPIKDIYREPMRLSDLWLIILIVLLAIAGIVFWLKRQGILAVRKRKRPAEVLPPHQIAHQQLSKLEKDKSWENGETNAYYEQISGLLREYIQATFGIPATKQTTAEIESALALRQDIDGQTRHRLDELLRASDMVKFADQQPRSSDHGAWIAEVRSFVRATEPKPETPESSTV